MLTHNLHRLIIIHANSIRKARRFVLFVAFLALLAYLACDGIARVNEALMAQSRLPVVERNFVQCLNGGAFMQDDGALVNCESVHTVKYKLTKGL